MKLIFLKGLPASGKSTWAKDVVLKSKLLGGDYKSWVVRVNKDEIREGLNRPWSRDLEKEVIKARDFQISQALSRGQDVISDDTNFAPKHEVRLRDLARRYKATFEVKTFDTPLDTCIARDALREDPVGATVIKEMHDRYLLPPLSVLSKSVERRILAMDPATLPEVVICDLDGTLSLMNGRGPYDHAKCDQDNLNVPVADILKMVVDGGVGVLFVSGREAKFYDQTIKFLDKFNVNYGPLLMRLTGDKRPDDVIKLEIYEAYIKDKYWVKFVLDDRDRVVKMWRKLGLTCLQVAEGNF